MENQYTTLELVEALIEQVHNQQDQIEQLTQRVQALEAKTGQVGN
ncbi:hypothetical protein [Schaalia turicensis]